LFSLDSLCTAEPNTIWKGDFLLRTKIFLALGLTAVLLLIAFLPAGFAATPEEARSAALDAVHWLREQQQNDGGFGDIGSDPGTTAETIFAAAAAKGFIDGWYAGSPLTSLWDYLEAEAPTYSEETAGKAAKLAIAAVAGNRDPRDFGGTDLIVRIESFYVITTGLYSNEYSGFEQAYALLGLIAAGETPPTAAVQALKDYQNPDGGWLYKELPVGGVSDTNTTAVAIQALIAAGEPAESVVITDAKQFLAGQQMTGGGFPFQDPPEWGGTAEADPSSTAMVIMALHAIGEDPASPDWTPDDVNPIDALLAMQNSATGAFQFYGGDSVFSTKDAIPALLGETLPVVSGPTTVTFVPMLSKD
jgi:hypothetical protein